MTDLILLSHKGLFNLSFDSFLRKTESQTSSVGLVIECPAVIIYTTYSDTKKVFASPQSLCVLCGSHWSLARSQICEIATSFVMSVRPSAWNNSAPTARIFMKLHFFFLKSVEKITVSLNSDNNDLNIKITFQSQLGGSEFITSLRCLNNPTDCQPCLLIQFTFVRTE